MPKKDRISPPPSLFSSVFPDEWNRWFKTLHDMLGTSPLKVQAYSVADLATATLSPARWGELTAQDAFSSIVFVYDETGGPTLAFSDGTDWRRVQDRVIVS